MEVSPELVWLVENARLMRTALNDTRQTIKHVRRLPQIDGSSGEHLPRAYAIAKSYLQAVDFEFTKDSLSTYLEAVCQKLALGMDELQAVKPMLQLTLLGKIAAIVDSLHDSAGLARWINSLREIGEEDWKDLLEKLSPPEQILREDPAGIYASMDFESRDFYRRRIADLAAHSGLEETEIARRAITLARSSRRSRSDPQATERCNHVGYYLVGSGKRLLEEQINYRPSPFRWVETLILAHPGVFYLGGILFTTVVVMWFLLSGISVPAPMLAALFLLLLPATESAVGIMNELTTLLVAPRPFPRLDFSKGIPAEWTTMVVVPTLLLSEEQTRRIVEELEVRYLANRDPNLHFALLTDPPDSSRAFDDKDELVGLCSQLIQSLNKKYAKLGKGSFFLFHRHRIYNPSEAKVDGLGAQAREASGFKQLASQPF